jgi:proline dehydrogenase
MLRSFFISLSKGDWAQRTITRWGVTRRASQRFVAGESLSEAIAAVKELNAQGIEATLDFLGENTSQPEEARQSAEEVLRALDAIAGAEVRCNISIKLSQFGLTLDEALCRENLARILDRARQHDNFIRIDMEDSALTDRTLNMYYWAREQGFDKVGIVIQAYLYRSEMDIQKLVSSGARIRLCKGAYQEPAEVAFPKKSDVDANYDLLASLLLATAEEKLLARSGWLPPLAAIASHDPLRIEHAKKVIARLELPVELVEFQMLYGIRRNLQQELAAGGYGVRVYVPYGTHWYPYFMRRLAERPANVWFFISNFFRR